ncbi:LuxR family transcriptional regulator [Solihabitans fulvus]|uniref:LuxR family transcriptional regulator n=1 Tax=Solihabitans fulvus TaxID=1892852 RepID=A0A5B2WXN5_9PSEU|nr:LuxR C-terminal-related transcriptional regulator [Solihabitans fulvus]KAA2255452.1 LuxR family transcriptional regulator [Solihabitans fulvus]
MPTDPARHTPPTQLTAFVGRAVELSAIAGSLSDTRLVTVVGPGGCGKTRLAVEAASRAATRWPDGVCWVDLTATSDPAAVPELLAAAADLFHTPGDGALPALGRQLGDRRMLVCLDNCEHVLAAAAELAAGLLRACPGVTVLATSREPLGVAGESVWRVPPLTADDAVALFEARSTGVAESDQARDAVRTACVRLDGIPLAIELAAAWSGTLSAQEILDGLDDRFALLVRGPRGVAARHQTLAASMAWSHDLLDDADRVLFRRLGVFHGGFTLATARSVCGFDGTDVLGGLRRLVDKSLVSADTRGRVARYRMLETIRQYAAARLAAAGEREAVADRHLDAFLALVEDLAPLLDRDKDAWREAVGAEQENLRAALDLGLSTADPARGRALAAALPWLWHLNGRGHDGLAFLRRAIDLGAAERSATQARLLVGLALVADTTRPAGLTYDAAQAALEIATEVDDARSACLARLLRAVGGFFQDFDGAAALAEEAGSQAREIGDGFVADGATALLGIILHLRDRHEEAVPVLREAVDGLVRRGDRGVASTALGFLADSALCAGDLAAARDLAADAVRTALPLADHHRVGSATSTLATVVGLSGRLAEACAVLDPVVRLVEGADPPPFVPGLARAMGFLRLWSGRPAEAVEWFRRETDWLGIAGDEHLAPQTLTGLAAALRATGDTDGAASACDRALAAARSTGMPRVTADALAQLAFLAAPTDPARAESLHHEALALRADHGIWLSCVDSLEALAAQSESPAEATRLLAACDRARAEFGYPRTVDRPEVAAGLLAALGDEAYRAASAEGRELGLPDAVAYARRARGKRGRPTSGWASLTPTEQSVVRLAVEGLSNPDIGTRLFMSRSTVKTHLSHVYAKLSVTNRTELATVAGPHLANF